MQKFGRGNARRGHRNALSAEIVRHHPEPNAGLPEVVKTDKRNRVRKSNRDIENICGSKMAVIVCECKFAK
jgi:hypothetical protein